MIQSKHDYQKYIKEEINNYKSDYPPLTTELKKIIKFQKIYRKLEYYTNCKKSLLSKIIKYFLQLKYNHLSEKYGFHIPINTIEKGLHIIHTGPIYINEFAKIGTNLRIHHMTTIGKSIGTNQFFPILGNNI